MDVPFTHSSEGMRAPNLDEDDIRGLHSHVRASADGDADVGLRERRRVVDAVADHGDAEAALLQRSHFGDLVGGQHLGEHLPDAHLGEADTG